MSMHEENVFFHPKTHGGVKQGGRGFCSVKCLLILMLLSQVFIHVLPNRYLLNIFYVQILF